MTATEKIKLHSLLTEAHTTYEKDLLRHAFFKTSNENVSKDIVQDTFLKAWNYLIKGGKIDTMKAFLYHILNNRIVDEYRKHKTSSLDVLIEKGFEPGTSDAQKMLNVLDGEKAVILIPRLPKTYKKVIHMKYVQDLSLEEISVLTGQSKNTIAVQIHRGLEKLKLLYSPVQLG